MTRIRIKSVFHIILALTLALGLGVSAAWSQTTTTGGRLNITVSDPAGASVPAADLELRDRSTNDVRRGATVTNGTFSFLNLPASTYELKISAKGFAGQVFETVEVKVSLETDIKATLKIGSSTETVTVSATETPLVQTEASAITNIIDTKQVFNLPILGRNAFSLVLTTPGWQSGGNGSTSGTFDNLPGGAIVSADFDGTQSISNRFRSSGYGYGYSVIDPRIENIDEFTVTTTQLDLSGSGSSAMKISIVTKRGSNAFHGRLYEDFRNTDLNANSWSNNANVNAQGVGLPRSIIKYNEFGGSVGGPVIKNKLFFFGTWSERKNPNSYFTSQSILTPLAQSGVFSYLDTTGALQKINLFQVAGSNGLPNTVNPIIQGQLTQVNGILGKGNLVNNPSDPNLQTLTFINNSNNTIYYPMIRGDYNFSEKLRFSLSYTQQKTNTPGNYNPNYPGIDPQDLTSYHANNKIIGLGIDYSIRPTLVNQFHAGYLYQFSAFSPEAEGVDLSAVTSENWAYGETSPLGGVYPRTAISSLYSQYSFNDSLSWTRGKHSITFGGTATREWDRYWNGPGGWPSLGFSLNSNDPAYAPITAAVSSLSSTLQGNARSLYSTLVGDISSVNIAVGRPLDPTTKQFKPYGQYNLNEVQQYGGVWAQDRWKLRPDLTLNFGLRWDFIGDDYDKDGAYTSAKSLADVYGPTTVGALFQPGALNGIPVPSFTARQHTYNSMLKNPEPAFALAWNPSADSGVLGKIIGHGKTVIRTGYSLRIYQEGAQNYWAFASGGLFFYQQGSANPDPTQVGPGYFKPGSLFLQANTNASTLPAYLLNPTTWSPTIPASNAFGSSFNTINPNIKSPYVQSWNFGIQRELPGGNALEVNYVGNLTLHSWLALNLNEMNIFSNGFLKEFNNAESNLAINQANGKGNTPYNYGLAGQVPLPIMTAAFGAAAGSNWTGTFTNLQQGAVATQARSMVSTTSYLCNVVGGANFSPCAGVAGAGYPLNFWNINPWAKTAGLNYLDAAGMSDYEALQVQFRQRLTHGAQFTFNYALAHSMTNGAINNLQSQGYTPYTLHNLNLNYQDSSFDIRHVFRVIGTYDLPFGKGKALLNYGGIVNDIVGSWTLGTVTAIQSGSPAQISGGYNTVSNTGSGVNFLQGLTAPQFQSDISIQHQGAPYVQTFGSQFIGANGAANPAYFTPASTPGQFGQWPIFRAPMWWASDLSATKSVPIHERWRFTLQATATNVFNHPTIGLGSLNILSTSFGRVTPGGSRAMELRANVEF